MRIIYSFLFSLITMLTYTQPTVSTQDSTVSVSVPKDEGAFKKLFKGKPGKSMTWGMLIPGGGHFYNRKYLTGVLAAGADIGVLIYAIDAQQHYNNLNSCYKQFLDGGTPSCGNFTSADQIRPFRNSARKTKEYAYLYLGITHIATSLWAFMQAHLIDFDVSEDLSLQFKLEKIQNYNSRSYPALALTIPISKIIK